MVRLIRANLHDVDRQQNSANNHFGMDVRSFHGTTDYPTLEGFNFWRGSVGISFKF